MTHRPRLNSSLELKEGSGPLTVAATEIIVKMHILGLQF